MFYNVFGNLYICKNIATLPYNQRFRGVSTVKKGNVFTYIIFLCKKVFKYVSKGNLIMSV